MSIQNVALLGADGTLGPAVLHALVKGGFKVTVLKRSSSRSPDNYPEGVKTTRVPDDLHIDALVHALTGQDAAVATIKGSQSEVQMRLADACIQAGVKRFIPADFGSCDSSSALTQELVPLYKRKTEMREYLIKLSQEHAKFSWSSIVCGHFFDWNLEWLHIWVKDRRADILDDGEYKCSFSTLARVGESALHTLQRPEETANRTLYVQSFCVTQNEVIKAFERATGSSFDVKKINSGEFRDEKKLKTDNGDKDAIEELVWYLGTVDADWTIREGFAMNILGLENENLDVVVKELVKG